MFILDKNVQAGALAPISRAGDLVTGFTVQTSGNQSWNRMSNGNLVQNDDTPYGRASYVCGGGIAQESWSSWGTEISSVSGNIFNCYADATVNGGAYRFKVLRVAGQDGVYGGGECHEYFAIGSVSSDWNVDWYNDLHKIVDGRRSGDARANRYFYYSEDPHNTTVAHNKQSTFRVFGTPTGTTPALSPMETDWGTITEPKSITLSLIGASSVTAKIDSGEEYALTPGTGNVVFDLAPKWGSLSYGAHTVIIRSKLNGYQCGARITFTKSSSVVSVTTTPHVTAHRPTLCRLVSDIVVPTGAVLTQQVTNNANDESPVWETYTGTKHEFSNATKTAGSWGLAARITIDNSDGNANAEIRDSLAIGAIFEGGAE